MAAALGPRGFTRFITEGAEEKLQAEEGEVESRSNPPAGRPLDHGLPVQRAPPTADDEEQVPIPERPREAVVDGQVKSQVEQETLRAQPQCLLAGHPDPDRPIPDREPLALVPRIPRVAHQPPVKVHANPRRRFVKGRPVVPDVEIPGMSIGQPAVAETPEKIVNRANRLGPDEQIEVAGGAEGRIGVEPFAESQSFERDHRKAFTFKAPE